MELVKSFRANKVKGEFVEDEKGACICKEYQINGIEVLVVVVSLTLNMGKRTSFCNVEKYIKNHVEEWELSANKELSMSGSDNNFFRLSDMELVEKSEAIELVDDLEKEILDAQGNSKDPKEYKKKEQLKEGYEREAQVLIDSCPQLYLVLEGHLEEKVEKVFGS